MRRRIYKIMKYAIMVIIFISIWKSTWSQSLQQVCLGGSDIDQVFDLVQVNSNKFLFTSATLSNDFNSSCNSGGGDGFVGDLDSNLLLNNVSCIGGVNDDGLNTICKMSFGYLVGGFSFSGCTNNYTDYWVSCYDNNFNLIWRNCYGGSDRDDIYQIIQTTDNSYLLAGITYSNDGNAVGNHSAGSDILIINIDSSGNVIWDKTFGGPGDEGFGEIVEMENNTFTVSGSANFDGGDVSGTLGHNDFWVFNFDSSGTLLWQRPYGGSSNESAFSLCRFGSNEILVTGEVSSNDINVSGLHGGWDSWIIRLDSIGNIVNQKCFGGSSYDYGKRIRVSDEGNIYLLSYSYSNDGDVVLNHPADFWLLKCDSSYNTISSNSFGGSNEDVPLGLLVVSDDNVICWGFTTSPDGDVNGFHIGNNCPGFTYCPDMWIINIKDSIINNLVESENSYAPYCIYSPTLNQIILNANGIKADNYQLKVVNSFGQIIFQSTIALNSMATINLPAKTPQGAYFFELKNSKNGKTYKGKMSILIE
jgi:hypothetical protein